MGTSQHGRKSQRKLKGARGASSVPVMARCPPCTPFSLRPIPETGPGPNGTDEQAEAQPEEVTCPSTRASQRHSGGFKPGPSDTRPVLVNTHPLAQEKGRI